MPVPPDEQRLKVEFGAEKTRTIREIGRARQQAKSTERKVATRGGDDLHVMGFAAEAALAEALGVRPDLSVGPTGHEGLSLRAHGMTFNTKWRETGTRDLAYWPGAVPDVNTLVLVTGDLPVIWLQGWVLRDTFCDRYEVTEFGDHGKRWIMPPAHLRPMTELYETLGVDPPPAIRGSQPDGHPLRPSTGTLFETGNT